MVAYMTINGLVELPIILNWDFFKFINEPLPSLISRMLVDSDIKILVLNNVTDDQIYWILFNLIGNRNIHEIIFVNRNLSPTTFLYLNSMISQTMLVNIKAGNYSVDLDLPTSNIRQICKKHERMIKIMNPDGIFN